VWGSEPDEFPAAFEMSLLDALLPNLRTKVRTSSWSEDGMAAVTYYYYFTAQPKEFSRELSDILQLFVQKFGELELKVTSAAGPDLPTERK
jgi:hypothetical protein